MNDTLQKQMPLVFNAPQTDMAKAMNRAQDLKREAKPDFVELMAVWYDLADAREIHALLRKADLFIQKRI